MTRATLHLSTVVVVMVSLILGWFVTFVADIEHFVDWQLATGGSRPWNAYTVPLNNYPPINLYLLTLVEAARSAMGIEAASRLNHLLIKIPNLVSQIIGGYVLLRALAPRIGERRAVWIAMAWTVSLGFLANVVWGQWDAVVSLLLLLAMLASLRDSWLAFGFWLGLALSTKFQVVFAVPVAGIFLITRTGWRGTLIATAGGLLALALAFAPMILGGRFAEASAAYTSSVDTWPKRSMTAWNLWELANGIEVKLLHRPMEYVFLDHRPVVAAISERFNYRMLGLLLFGSYLLALLVLVARRRTLRSMLLGIPLAGVAMFLLATQMHERYILPPAALMVLWLLLDDRRFQWQFFYWMCAAGLNQFLSIAKYQNGPTGMSAYMVGAAIFAPLNLLMFAWLTWLVFTDRGVEIGTTKNHGTDEQTDTRIGDRAATRQPSRLDRRSV